MVGSTWGAAWAKRKLKGAPPWDGLPRHDDGCAQDSFYLGHFSFLYL